MKKLILIIFACMLGYSQIAFSCDPAMCRMNNGSCLMGQCVPNSSRQGSQTCNAMNCSGYCDFTGTCVSASNPDAPPPGAPPAPAAQPAAVPPPANPQQPSVEQQIALAQGNCDTEYSTLVPEAETCKGLETAAVTACERIQMTSQMMSLATTAAQALGSNDQKKLCDTSMKLNALMGAANVGFGMTCGSKARSCIAKCSTQLQSSLSSGASKCKMAAALNANQGNMMMYQTYTEYGEKMTQSATAVGSANGQCGGNKSMSTMAYMQAGMNAITAAQSMDCKKILEAVKCETVADIKGKPECYFQLCGPGGRFDGTKECKPTELDCTASVNFGAPYCICQANPQDPVCPGGNATGGGAGGGGSGGLDGGSTGITTGGTTGGGPGAYGANNVDGGFTDDDLSNALGGDGSGETDPFGNKNNQGAGGAAGGMQPGSPFSPGGGFSGNPGANAGKGGAGKGPYNTDILQGPGGSGGYAAGGGGQYPFGSGANGGKDGMNLRDFLPGGKRGIAGQKELEKNGVSDANGLSNFQKVTRQVNELRRSKQTIESR